MCGWSCAGLVLTPKCAPGRLIGWWEGCAHQGVGAAADDAPWWRPEVADRADPPASRPTGLPAAASPGRCAARKMQSRAAVALTPRLTTIWRLDTPAADSLSPSRIVRTGNLGPGIAPLPVEKERSHAESRITQRRPTPPSTGWSRSKTSGSKSTRSILFTARTMWRMPKRLTMMAAPGHEQHTPNMATGASAAELAVLLVDARKGLLAQTRRHAHFGDNGVEAVGVGADRAGQRVAAPRAA